MFLLNNVIVSQKGSNGNRKLRLFGWDYNSFCMRKVYLFSIFCVKSVTFWNSNLKRRRQFKNIFIKVCVRFKGKKCWSQKVTLSALQFWSNECGLIYWVSVRLKMNQRKYTPLHEKDTEPNENSPMETTINVVHHLWFWVRFSLLSLKWLLHPSFHPLIGVSMNHQIFFIHSPPYSGS